jgi:glutathione synthase/RimK-type ligase-like ATP-grasp enzyme
MLSYLACLVEACQDLGLKYNFNDQNHNYLVVELPNGQKMNFLNTTTPFNREDVARIAQDKSFTYQTLLGLVNMPKTEDFIDPFIKSEFQEYAKIKNFQDIAQIIQQNFDSPVITKPNFKSQGVNVQKSYNFDQILTSVQTIFDKSSRNYDFMLLAQDYVPTYQEFRVIVYKKKVVLLYLKDVSEASFTDNLSPLHWQNSKAVQIQDQILNREIEDFLAPMFTKLDLEYGGLDLILDPNYNWWLIEINTHPGFKKFLEDNPSQNLTQMYRQILENTI